MNTLTENELGEICGGGDVPVATWPTAGIVLSAPSFGWGWLGIVAGWNSEPKHMSD